MITVDDSRINRFERDLEKAHKKAIPFAVVDSLNSAAKWGQRIARRTLADQMILRNRWTSNSVKPRFARFGPIDRIESAVGSIQPYLELQEFGGWKSAKPGRESAPIATPKSSGESAIPRRKLPTRLNRLKHIVLGGTAAKVRGKRRKGPLRFLSRYEKPSKKQKNFLAIKAAREARSKFVYLETAKTKGIFSLRGGRPQLIHSLKYSRVKIPKNPWLYPSALRVKGIMPGLYVGALQKQLTRHGLFRHNY